MANPVLTENAFRGFVDMADAQRMTVEGTCRKLAMLLLAVVLPAAFVWHRFMNLGAEAVMPFMLAGVIGGLVLCLTTVFAKTWSPFTAPLYAVCEGLFLGGLSAILENAMKARFGSGVVMQAVLITFGIFAVMVALYATRILRATPAFTKGVLAATLGVMLVYLATLVLNLFGTTIPYIHTGSPIGIAFSGAVIVIAALNLVLDFSLIEEGARQGAPKWMEWYGAFGLLVTLVWLYVEVLRLLVKLRGRN